MLRLDLIKTIDQAIRKHGDEPDFLCGVCYKLAEIKNEEEKPRNDKRGYQRKEARAKNVRAVELLIGLLK